MAGFNPLAALYAGMKIKKGPASISATTPPFSGGIYKPPVDPGNPIDLGTDSGYTPEQADLRATIAHPPQEGVKPDGKKIGGFRRVLGEIASNVGPLIGGPAVAGIGEKLLHPGLDKWNSDVARKQALAQMSVDARNHQDLEANRKLQQQQRLDNQSDKEQGAVDRVEGKGGWQAPMPTPQASLSTRLYQPPQPMQTPTDLMNTNAGNLPTSQRSMMNRIDTKTGKPIASISARIPQPGKPIQTENDLANANLYNLPTDQTSVQQTMPNVEDQVDPRTGKRVGDVGDVEWLNTPGTQGKQNRPYVRPSQQTLQDMEVRKRTADLEAAKTEMLGDDEAQQYNDLGFKANLKGKKMTPVDVRAIREDIKGRLNSADTIKAKADPASKQNEYEWIATVNDPNADAGAVKVAQANLDRLHNERMATRTPPNHDFTREQTGRSLLDKAEKEYRGAAQSADSLASFVQAAQSGNKVAAQAIPLEGVLNITTAQGVHRINRTELEQIQGAGSLFDNIMGKVGKLTAGQPIPPDVQQDFANLSTLLKKGAYNTYRDAHTSAVKRYGLTDEAPLPEPGAKASVVDDLVKKYGGR